MPKISIILPVYNGERYLRESLKSLLAKTHGDFELIVCDDGSRDNSCKIVRSYHDPRIEFTQMLGTAPIAWPAE